MFRQIFIGAVILVFSVAALGQTEAGGGKAGIGRVFDGAGRSAAAKELQRKMNGGLLKLAVARSKTVKPRSGPTRVSPVVTPGRRPSAAPAVHVEEPQPSFTEFRPTSDTDFVDRFAAAISTDPNERALVKQLVTAVRGEFEKEVTKRGRPNNLAAAFTFFVASTVTVYHNDPEPSDAAVDQLWDGLNDTLNGLPEMSKLSDAEKQEMYEMLVACGGLVWAGHVYTKESGDANAAAVYRQLAGELIRTVLKSDPEKLRFNSGGLNIAG